MGLIFFCISTQSKQTCSIWFCFEIDYLSRLFKIQYGHSFQVANWQGGPSWTDGNKVPEHLNMEKYIYCIKKTWRVQALKDAIRAMSLLHSMQCHDDGVMQAVLPFVGHLCCEGKCFLQLVLLGELFGGLPQ